MFFYKQFQLKFKIFQNASSKNTFNVKFSNFLKVFLENTLLKGISSKKHFPRDKNYTKFRNIYKYVLFQEFFYFLTLNV